MIQDHLSRIIQSLIALPLLILTISHWNQNRIGQNLINLTTVSTYAIGLDYIIILYRWIMNFQQSFCYQLTIVFIMLYVICKLFQKFHPTQNYQIFNSVCQYNLLTIIVVNLLFVLFMILVLFCYACRQIYRLMTETLLSTSQTLQQSERNAILGMRNSYYNIKKQQREVNESCCICINDFQNDNPCILLPGCLHCFHYQCISEWIQGHSTCPYCRNNLRLSLI